MDLNGKVAAAVLLVADSLADSAFDIVATNALRGSFSVDNGQDNRPAPRAPLFWVRASFKDRGQNGQKLRVRLVSESFLYPSVNVVGKVPGKGLLGSRYHAEHPVIPRDSIVAAKWMFETGWLAANADARPRLGPNFKLERGR